MSYNDLTRDTGQTPERRREEAADLIIILKDACGDDLLGLKENEREFIASMEERDWCSPKQLLWLRDLKAKYAE